jgi:hypothetical protein
VKRCGDLQKAQGSSGQCENRAELVLPWTQHPEKHPPARTGTGTGTPAAALPCPVCVPFSALLPPALPVLLAGVSEAEDSAEVADVEEFDWEMWTGGRGRAPAPAVVKLLWREVSWLLPALRGPLPTPAIAAVAAADAAAAPSWTEPGLLLRTAYGPPVGLTAVELSLLPPPPVTGATEARVAVSSGRGRDLRWLWILVPAESSFSTRATTCLPYVYLRRALSCSRTRPSSASRWSSSHTSSSCGHQAESTAQAVSAGASSECKWSDTENNATEKVAADQQVV